MKKTLFFKKNEKTNRYFTLHEDGLRYYDADDDSEPLYTSCFTYLFEALDAFYDLMNKFEKINEEEIVITDKDGNVLEDEDDEEDDPTAHSEQEEPVNYTEEEKEEFLKLCREGYEVYKNETTSEN